MPAAGSGTAAGAVVGVDRAVIIWYHNSAGVVDQSATSAGSYWDGLQADWSRRRRYVASASHDAASRQSVSDHQRRYSHSVIRPSFSLIVFLYRSRASRQPRRPNSRRRIKSIISKYGGQLCGQILRREEQRKKAACDDELPDTFLTLSLQVRVIALRSSDRATQR